MPRRGFTLIELILVMTLLVVAVGLMHPVLSGFFRGRVMDSEARRLLGLTRYAQNRAVSEGIPMVLWFEDGEGRYGLEAAAGYLDEDSKRLAFDLDKELSLEVAPPPMTGTAPIMNRSTPGAGLRSGSKGKNQEIRFLPDGFIADTSPEYVVLRRGEADAVWLVQDTNRVSYALQSTEPTTLRR